MRHFFALPSAISCLPLRVPVRSATTPLISNPGFANTRAARVSSTNGPTKPLSYITSCTELDLNATALAVEQPVRITDRWPPPSSFLDLFSSIGEACFTTDRGWKGSVWFTGPFVC